MEIDLEDCFYIGVDSDGDITKDMKITYKGKDISQSCIAIVLAKQQTMKMLSEWLVKNGKK